MGPETMTGAYLPGNRQVDLQQVPVPVPGHGEVLVRVKASTICGSDLRAITASTSERAPEAYQGESLPADDWRKCSGDFHPPPAFRSLKFANDLGAIVGARNTGQVEGWLPAADFTLSAEVAAEVDGLIAEHAAADEHSMADLDPSEL